MTRRVIELKNSDTAVFGEIVHTARANNHDPVPPLVRRLIAEQLIQPDDILEIRRGDTLCFKPCRAKLWAKFDVVDDPRDGLVRRAAFIGPHLAAVKPARSVGRGFWHERAAVRAEG